MTRLDTPFRVSEAGPNIRTFIKNLYHGVEPYFLQPDITTLNELGKVAYWKAYDRRRREYEKKWGENLTDVLNDVGSRVAATYKNTQSASRVDAVCLAEMTKQLGALYPKMYFEVELDFARRARSSVEFKAKPFDLADPNEIGEMAEWNRKTIGEKITNVTASTRKRIAKIIREAVARGDSIFQIVDKLSTSFPFSRARAYSIARTEIISTSNASTHFSIGHFMPTGKMTKDWLATGDERTRETHIKAGISQRDVDYEEPFSVGGAKLMFPGDSSLGAPGREVIQCRCTALYHLPKPRSLR